MKLDKDSAKTYITIKLIDLARIAFQSVALMVCFFFASESIKALAGNDTTANFAFSYFTSSESTYGIPWLAAVAGFIYGYGERRLRQRKTRHFQGRITKLESIIDKNRSSSGLATDGQTHPEDRI